MALIIHGHFIGDKESLTHKSWRKMLFRCYNKKYYNFQRYGGRGIIVYQPWHSFPEFLKDVGERPNIIYQLDRFPNKDGNYEPGNVRWATPKENSNNKCNNRFITVFGLTKTMAEWVAFLELPYRNYISGRLKTNKNLTPEQVIIKIVKTKDDVWWAQAEILGV